ncbi:hypothetical protein A0H81_11333 [Grifola frondosa]|uniref:Uncharacterized protein n=1 Tax=Grifola frondosa TaxID=5627 RepID=A0A1C7LY25_GRIFR|nr:hypothetical protein A0H81_11333 [Grifola frondosa]
MTADKGKGKSIDKGLDDIFRITVTQPGPSNAVESLAKEAAQRTKAEKKRKLPEDAPAGSSKRSKSEKGKKPNHGADAVKSEKLSKKKASRHGRAKDLTHAEDNPRTSAHRAQAKLLKQPQRRIL